MAKLKDFCIPVGKRIMDTVILTSCEQDSFEKLCVAYSEHNPFCWYKKVNIRYEFNLSAYTLASLKNFDFTPALPYTISGAVYGYYITSDRRAITITYKLTHVDICKCEYGCEY